MFTWVYLGGTIVEEEYYNLKGKKDKLKYFRLKDTGMFTQRSKLINIEDTQEYKTYFYPEQDKLIFEENQVRNFSLDEHGESIPAIDGELTIFNNYFFDFWGFYLGDATRLYAYLKRHAYGEKDYVYPNFELISEKMDKSRKTLHTYLDILEHYGFVYKFNVINESRNNMEESPIFKVRKQTPLLSKKLIEGDNNIIIPENAPAHVKKMLKKEREGLPPRLRKEHEVFTRKHLKNKSDILPEQLDYEEIYNKYLQYKDILKNIHKKDKSEEVDSSITYSETEVHLKKNMTQDEKLLLAVVLESAQANISKPSFDTWFKDILIKVQNNILTIYAPNEFAMDWLEERYKDNIVEWVNKTGSWISDINFSHYEFNKQV